MGAARRGLRAQALLLRPLFLAALLSVPLLTSTSAWAEPTEPLDLNQASVEDLCELPGIGPKKAEAIVEKRRHRRFTRVTQLLEVKGIGQRTLARLRPLIFVGKAGAVRTPAAHPLLQGAPEKSAADGGVPP